MAIKVMISATAFHTELRSGSRRLWHRCMSREKQGAANLHRSSMIPVHRKIGLDQMGI